MKTIITIEIDGEDVNVSTEQVETEEVNHSNVSPYARWFDDCSPVWEKDEEYNRTWIMFQQRYANDLLKTKGHVFLNTVYPMLGLPITKEGQYIGWTYDKDKFIEFKIIDSRLDDPTKQLSSGLLIDFNVDGVILDKI